MFPSLISATGQISAFIKGRAFLIPSEHHNYARLVDAINKNDPDRFLKLADAKAQIEGFSMGNIKLTEGVLRYKKEQVHNVLVERILQFIKQKKPYKPLVRFLDRLMENPDEHSKSESYRFVEAHGLPITEQGYLLAFKRVSPKWRDFWSGKINNSIGRNVSMSRKSVDPDWRLDCSSGFHVGSRDYVQHFNTEQGHVVIVKIDPKDIVAVSSGEHNKMRVCRYTVLSEITNAFDADQFALDQLVYQESNVKRLKNKLVKKVVKKVAKKTIKKSVKKVSKKSLKKAKGK